MKIEPRFDRYIFIEKNPKRCSALEGLKSEFPNLSSDIIIKQGYANEQIQHICSKDWRGHRAVLFLDPYGMQVKWKTIEAIAATKAIDLWILFPDGIGVNRLTPQSGEVPDSWRTCLNELLGTEGWYKEFYYSMPSLFADDDPIMVKKGLEVIGNFFNDRLKSVFAGVAKRPAVLRNSRNKPLYLFCFAVGNERAVEPALKIADYILENVG